MNESEVKKCSKCGSSELGIKDLTINGKWFNYLRVRAYVCRNCHYVELFEV